MQKLVADGGEKLPETLLNVIKKKREEKDSEGSVDLDIRWRLLCGKMASDETRVLLSKAVSIFHVSYFLYVELPNHLFQFLIFSVILDGLFGR